MLFEQHTANTGTHIHNSNTDSKFGKVTPHTGNKNTLDTQSTKMHANSKRERASHTTHSNHNQPEPTQQTTQVQGSHSPRPQQRATPIWNKDAHKRTHTHAHTLTGVDACVSCEVCGSGECGPTLTHVRPGVRLHMVSQRGRVPKHSRALQGAGRGVGDTHTHSLQHRKHITHTHNHTHNHNHIHTHILSLTHSTHRTHTRTGSHTQARPHTYNHTGRRNHTWGRVQGYGACPACVRT